MTKNLNMLGEADKAMKKWTWIRKDEAVQNKKVLDETKWSQSLLQKAIATLRDFYEKKKAQLAMEEDQASDPMKQKQKESYNNNAPQAGGGAYKPNFSWSDAIIGMLEAVMGDFAKEISEVEVEESIAQKAYEKFAKEWVA